MEPSSVEEPATEQPSVVMPAQRREPDAPSGHVPSSVPTVTVETSPAAESAQTAQPPQTVPLVPLVPSTPPAAVTRRAQAGNRFPLWLAISFGALSLLCVAGLGIGFHYYDKATKPDRTTPAIAVQNYLQALLVDRSDAEAAPYVCPGASDLASLKAFRDGAIAYASARGDTVSFGWTISDIDTINTSTALANVTITQVTSSVGGQPGQSLHPWILTTTHTSGWRVCEARQAS